VTQALRAMRCQPGKRRKPDDFLSMKKLTVALSPEECFANPLRERGGPTAAVRLTPLLRRAAVWRRLQRLLTACDLGRLATAAPFHQATFHREIEDGR
jgi:hypothetical protein